MFAAAAGDSLLSELRCLSPQTQCDKISLELQLQLRRAQDARRVSCDEQPQLPMKPALKASLRPLPGSIQPSSLHPGGTFPWCRLQSCSGREICSRLEDSNAAAESGCCWDSHESLPSTLWQSRRKPTCRPRIVGAALHSPTGGLSLYPVRNTPPGLDRLMLVSRETEGEASARFVGMLMSVKPS